MTRRLNPAKKRPVVVDLFSGAGGFSLGAARAGFDVLCAVEIDKHAIESHTANFPNANHLDKDIARVSAAEIKSVCKLGARTIDGVIGGPPCQGFSVIGRASANDPRNRLFYHFFRIVQGLKPKFFLAENVPGILQAKNVPAYKGALRQVEKDYVVLPPLTLTASDWGAPTTRTRVFFFGYRKEHVKALSEIDFAPSTAIRKVFVRDALRGLPVRINGDGRTQESGWKKVRYSDADYYQRRLSGQVPPLLGDKSALIKLRKERVASGFLGTVHSKAVLKRYSKIACGTRDAISKSHRLDPAGFCPTLRAGTGLNAGRYQAVRPLHPTEDRVITLREAARLQGFPDWFQFSDTRWHSFRLIGNSVSPLLAERVLRVIINSLNRGHR